MPRPQFTLRALLVAMLVVGAFFGGIHFERHRRLREEQAAAEALSRFRPRKPMTPDELEQFETQPRIK